MSKPSLKKNVPLPVETAAPQSKVVLLATKTGNNLTILCVDIYQSTSQISQIDADESEQVWLEKKNIATSGRYGE